MMAMKANFEKKTPVFLEVVHESNTVITLDTDQALALLDIRSLGYNKIQQGVLHNV